MSSVIEVNVGGLAFDEKTRSHVVILREANGNRVLPIWIGPAEASAIAMEIAGKRFQRPLTHDLMATIVKGLKAKVSKIIISDLRDNTFFAKIVLEREKDNEIVNVDARPSDSIALALRTQSPIYLSETLLEGTKDVSLLKKEEKEKTEEERAEELRKFLEELDPEDFGKFTP
ncbi:MAG: bifunctional nuclease family protein [Candidatus Eisenbacteria bacterium]|nr:bifunctional nuclease family protein [Candidatus Eisenbacteria bacterium]